MEELRSIHYPECGDLVEPLNDDQDFEPMLILQGLHFWDAGLGINEKSGVNFYKPKEIVQLRGEVNGVIVWVEIAEGRSGLGNGKTGYRIAFGEHPDYTEMVGVREAAAILKKNIPPTQYVRVTPEEWAARRS